MLPQQKLSSPLTATHTHVHPPRVSVAPSSSCSVDPTGKKPREGTTPTQGQHVYHLDVILPLMCLTRLWICVCVSPLSARAIYFLYGCVQTASFWNLPPPSDAGHFGGTVSTSGQTPLLMTSGLREHAEPTLRNSLVTLPGLLPACDLGD